MSLRDWLFSSRFTSFLKKQIEHERAQYDLRLAEKDLELKRVRIDLALARSENERMRLVLMPLGSPAGQMYAQKFQAQPLAKAQVDSPNFGGSLDWQGELNQMIKEEEDGIRGRKEE